MGKVDEFNADDAEGFAYYNTHLGEDETGFYEEQLKLDRRKDVIKGDSIQRYNDFNEYRKTTLAKDVERTVDLIPDYGEITVKDLRSALTSSFAMSKGYANKVIKEVGSNDVRIKARNHSYDKSIEEIRLSKT